jgi:hypothetical protein
MLKDFPLVSNAAAGIEHPPLCAERQTSSADRHQ